MHFCVFENFDVQVMADWVILYIGSSVDTVSIVQNEGSKVEFSVN